MKQRFKSSSYIDFSCGEEERGKSSRDKQYNNEKLKEPCLKDDSL